MANLEFDMGTTAKNAMIKKMEKEIKQFYVTMAKDLNEEIKKYDNSLNETDAQRALRLKKLQQQLMKSSEDISNQMYNKVYDACKKVSESTMNDYADFLSSLGLDSKVFARSLSGVPTAMVNRILTGKIYKSGWGLSDTIWGYNESFKKNIYDIVASGLAKNLSTADIAKNLSQFVDPTKKKDWNKICPDGRRLYNKAIEYNSQRLARTLIQHSYQQTVMEACKDNPFIKKIKWRSTGSRACPLCLERNGKEYEASKVPMDHPNGMCTMKPMIDKEDADNQLKEWFNNPDYSNKALDKYAKKLGYTRPDFKIPKQTNPVKVSIDKDTSKYYKDFMKQPLAKFLNIEDVMVGNLTTSEKHALNKYSSSAYKRMNRYMRELAISSRDPQQIADIVGIYDDELDAVNILINLFNKTKLEEELIVRRLTDFGDIAGLFMDGDFDKNQSTIFDNVVKHGTQWLNDTFKGAIGEFQTFTSTAGHNSGVFGEQSNVEILIVLPKGTSAIPMSQLSQYSSERECLLGPGTKVKFLGAESATNEHRGVQRIFLEIIL